MADEIIKSSIVISNNGWQHIRTIAVPGSATTYSDTDWLADQDVAAAKAAGVGVIQSSRGENGDIAGLAIMATAFDDAGAMLTGAQLAAALIATIHIEEITTAKIDDHASHGRILSIEEVTSLASDGMQVIAKTAAPIPRGLYAIRLEGVSGMPATAGKRIAIQAKLI